jgi:hypothetical protein
MINYKTIESELNKTSLNGVLKTQILEFLEKQEAKTQKEEIIKIENETLKRKIYELEVKLDLVCNENKGLNKLIAILQDENKNKIVENKLKLTKNEILLINNFCYAELKNIPEMYGQKISHADIEEYKNKIKKLFNKTDVNKINKAVKVKK